MGLKVRIPNAFTINQLGTPDGSIPYPFGLACHGPIHGVYNLVLFPQSVLDLCDILKRFEMLAVFEISHYEIQSNKPIALAEIAAIHEIDCQAIDASAIVIAADDLAGLLSGLDHYNFHAFDVPLDHVQDEIVTGLLHYHEQKWGKTDPLLPRLPRASFFLDSHDDSDLYLEAYDLSFFRQIFERALQMYAGTVLAQESGFEGNIAEIPAELIETLWPNNAGLTILRSGAETRGLRLRIGVSDFEFSFRERRSYPITRYVEYDASTGEWSLLPPVALHGQRHPKGRGGIE